MSLIFLSLAVLQVLSKPAGCPSPDFAFTHRNSSPILLCEASSDAGAQSPKQLAYRHFVSRESTAMSAWLSWMFHVVGRDEVNLRGVFFDGEVTGAKRSRRIQVADERAAFVYVDNALKNAFPA
ncbi:uncharacterized protein PHALS_08022 [Plasmopara halstedii]|uniref:RxLR-like protein n=1 Tax=Plasmopara halstedii TaxID=4781 RepID=A0A0P1B666_PLAHL|nr:uncharacterized protein PHALS_08022 [Plasmopara halstedii]CEG50301.1 hypothetical protein PHALS_08022 [Plasmopara halstedii]|eukprot:XP_024586670.1 hypothetical protein PHALS_08022 [Plasmopara halstedii]